jgi:hypothetical protein
MHLFKKYLLLHIHFNDKKAAKFTKVVKFRRKEHLAMV